MANIRYQRMPSQDEHVAGLLTVEKDNLKFLEAECSLEGAPLTVEETKDALDKLHKMSQFESMSFDPTENDVERHVAHHRPYWDYVKEEGWRWFISALIGFVMGTIAFGVDTGIEVLNTVKFNTTWKVLESRGGFVYPYLTFCGFALLYGLVAGSLVSYVEPLAAGSGIPEIKTYLNGVHIKGLLRLKALVAKLLGVMFSISAGLVAGKEGPFVHGGGVVGGGLGTMGSKFLTDLSKGKVAVQTNRAIGGYFRNHADHRDFVAIGTAAGVSTAFAAPIGGLLFTIEEGASFYSLATVLWRGFLATCTGLITLHFFAELKADPNSAILRAKLGITRDFGLYSDAHADYGRNFFYYLWEVPIFILIGALGGAIGALFIAINVQITRVRQRYIPVRCYNRRLVEVLVVSFVTATATFLLCYHSPCRPYPSDVQKYLDVDTPTERFFAGGGQHDYFPQMWCSKGEYSLWGQMFFTPLTQALRLVMHMGEPIPNDVDMWEFHWSSLVVLLVYTFILMTWTYGIGAATGLFVPSLTVGATVGRLIGRLVAYIVHSSSARNVPISLGSYAIVGAAASLGGATRMTISIVILVMETSGAMELLVPIMLAAWVAKMVGDSLGLGIYDTHIELRGVPLLNEDSMDTDSRVVHDELSVRELMSDEIVYLQPVVKISDVVQLLKRHSHGGFPVSSYADGQSGVSIKGPMKIDGLVTRAVLLRLLQRRVGFISKGTGTASKYQYSRRQGDLLALKRKIEPYPMRICAKTDQEGILAQLSPSDMDLYLDLRPFMQRHPFFVNADASLTRAYRLFRTMGLRHLFVTPAEPTIIGVLTRKDIIKENAKLVLGEKAHRELDKKLRKDSINQKFTRAGTRRTIRFMPDFCPAEGTGTAVATGAGTSLIERVHTLRRLSVDDSFLGLESADQNTQDEGHSVEETAGRSVSFTHPST